MKSVEGSNLLCVEAVNVITGLLKNLRSIEMSVKTPARVRL